jgi:hypothetical protein
MPEAQPPQLPSAAHGSQARITAYRLGYSADLRIVPAPADREWMEATKNGWANRCLPLRVANQAGWVVLNDCAFEVTWTGKPQLDSIKFTFRDGRKSLFVSSMFGYGIVTWEIPFLFRTPDGYNLLARGPANLPKDGAFPLEGLVEADWSVASFTMNWKLTRRGYPLHFEKDEPICMLVPQRRSELEIFEPEIRNIESDPELQGRFQQWIDGRNKFVAEQKQKGPPEKGASPWQGHYTRGTTPAGGAAREHQVKLKLHGFAEREPRIERYAPGDAASPAEGRHTGAFRALKRLFMKGR